MNAATIRVSQQLQGIAKDLDSAIAKAAGERIAFALFVFTEGRASYISTADRAEIIREIKQLLAHWEQGMPDVAAHHVSG